MTLRYEMKGRQTIATMNHLLDSGIKKLSLLIRHSERFFSKDARLEPFMGLTDEGKEYAVDFGTALRPDHAPRLCSSFMGRCIETAFLIDKAFTRNHHQVLEHNCINEWLSPFYVKDIAKAVPLIEKQGNNRFIRNWFANRIDESIMLNPEKASDRLSEFMIGQIKSLKEDQVAVCVSHDWNIFPLKEFKLGLKHETAGDVGYLDGVVFFEKEGQYYITSYQKDPVLL